MAAVVTMQNTNAQIFVLLYHGNCREKNRAVSLAACNVMVNVLSRAVVKLMFGSHVQTSFDYLSGALSPHVQRVMQVS